MRITKLVIYFLMSLGLYGCIDKIPHSSDPNVALPVRYKIYSLRILQLPEKTSFYQHPLVYIPNIQLIHIRIISLKKNHYCAKLFIQPNNKFPLTVEEIAKT